jgi:glycerol uptake facilitator-like aquaporin
VATFFLVLVVCATAIDERGAFSVVSGLPIGFVVTFDILAGGPLTGAAMNPARVFGPAAVGGYWANHWVYWVGPIAGGAIAGLLYSTLYLKRPAVS